MLLKMGIYAHQTQEIRLWRL